MVGRRGRIIGTAVVACLAAGLAGPAAAAPGEPAAGPVASVTVAGFPDQIVSLPAAGLRPASFWVLTGNADGSAANVVGINESTRTQTTFPVSPGTNWLAVDPGLGLVWALASVDGHNPAALSALTEINAVAGTTTTMSLTGIAAGFAGLAVNTVSHELYLLGGLGDVYTVSESSPAVPTAPFISTGQSSPYGMAIADDPVTGNIWVSADQDVHGFSASGASLGAPVALPGDPASLTVDSRTGTVWVAAAQSVSAFAESKPSAIRTKDLAVNGIALNPAAGQVWVSSYQLEVLSGSTLAVLDTYPGQSGGGGYSGLAFDPGGDQFWLISSLPGSAGPNLYILSRSAPAVTSAATVWFSTKTPAVPGEYGGASNTYQIAATGFPPPVYAETGKLPRGVTLNAATGLISGTPPATGTYAVKIRAANSVGASVQRTLTIHVGAAPVLACKAGRCDFTFYAGVKVHLDLRIGGDPATHFIAVEPLPHGLRVTQGGLIYGTPTRVQLRKPERLDIFNAVGGDDLPGSMRVLASHPAKFSSRSRWSVRRGHWARFTIRATGAPAPHVRLSGHLPRGLRAHTNRNGKAVLYGTVSRLARPGRYKVKVTASNGAGRPASQTLIITVR